MLEITAKNFSISKGGNVKRKMRYLYAEGYSRVPSGNLFTSPCSFPGLPLSGCGKEEKVQPQAPIVEVAEVTQKDVPVISDWVGTPDGVVNATIRAQVQGYLIKQNYTEGDFVRKGQVLFEIDPREYQAALAQAEATLSQSKGAVEQTKASLEKAKAEVAVQDARWTTAKANLARVKPLAEQNAVSKKDLDDAIGTDCRPVLLSMQPRQASTRLRRTSWPPRPRWLGLRRTSWRPRPRSLEPRRTSKPPRPRSSEPRQTSKRCS